MSETEESKRSRKLSKTISGQIVIIEELETGRKLEMDCSQLSADIREQLVPLAINHRVGDAAAGKSGDDAFAAMEAVWQGLCEGKMSIRGEGATGPRVSKKAILDKLEGLDSASAEEVKAALAKVGISI